MSSITGTYNLQTGWVGAQPFSPNSFTPPAGIQFFEKDGKVIWNRPDSTADLRRIYETCAPLSSIINRMADAFAGGNLEVLNANTLNYVRGAYKDWEKLLNNPNPLQSKRQYFRQQYTYTYINGWSLGLKVTPTGFGMPTKIWPLPYWCIQVEDKRKSIFSMTREDLLSGIYFCYNGARAPLNPDDLILFTDESGDIDERTWLPKSRIIQLQYPITTQLAAVEAEVTMIQRKGAIGILSNKSTDATGATLPLRPNDKKDMQDEFRQYGLSRDQWQYIISNVALEWQPMAFPTKELMLHESDVKAFKMIADAFKFPFELTAMSERKNLANVTVFDTILYQNAIIPNADAFDEQLMIGLGAVDNNIVIRHDYSHVPALQKSEKEKGEGEKAMNEALLIRWNNGLITKNQWLEKIGEDKVKNPGFDKYKNELTPDELGVVVPEDNSTDKNTGNGSNNN